MSVTLPLPRTPLPTPVPVRSLLVALQLAPAEARRLLLHPVFVVGFLLNVTLVVVVADNGPRDAFDAVSTGATFYSGVFVYFAASLVATRDRRARSGELLAPLSTSEHERTLGLCLAALAPALLSLAFTIAMHAQLSLRGLYLVEPSAAHLAQGPLTVLGGALLGVMVARWAPYPGVSIVVMVAMVAWNVYATNHPEIGPLSTFVSWASYGPGRGWHGLEPGSAGWHAVYLALLCAMAATGAVLRATPHRRRVLSLGAVLTVLAALAGAAALP